jgi:hypothetical protein
MFKKIFSASLMLLLTYSIKAQNTLHQTLNSAGNTAKVSSFTIDFAVGETVSETLKSNSNIVTQGFIQPVITIQTGFSFHKQGEGCQFSIFPNPTADYLNFNLQDVEEVDFEIYKIDGTLVGKYRSVNKFTDVSTLAKGTYLVKLLCNNTNNSFQKFVKI